MRVEQVVPSLSDEASGPSYSVRRLCESLAAIGLDVGIVSASLGPNPHHLRAVVNAPVAFPQYAFSPKLGVAVAAAMRDADIVHNHGLWAFPNFVVGLAKRRHAAQLISSPRGTLAVEALSFSTRRKRLAWPLQRLALSRSDCLHATSESEMEDLRRMGFRAPIAVIPNGIDVAPQFDRGTASERRRLLYLGRLHPSKGLELLLELWAQLEKAHPDWDLQIVGKGDERYVSSLLNLVKQLACSRVSFTGPMYGADKDAAYRSADLFVLPTLHENFAMVVAEALAQGCPVIATQGAPWRDLETHRCGWWPARTSADLGQALSTAMGMSRQDLQSMGGRGREWMQRDFEWGSVAKRMAGVYSWMLHGGACPPDVRVEP